MTATILLAGCGDLGCEIARQLLSANYKVIGLRRSDADLPAGMLSIQADVTRPDSLQQLSQLNPDILIYCVAADAYNDASYRAAYVDGLRNVLAALAGASTLRHVFFISSTGVYGQQSEALLDETTPALASDFSGIRMLEAEGLLKGLPCTGTALRLSGIYGPGRNRMIRQAADPQSWPSANRWTNRIHRDDAARFTALLVAHALQGKPLEQCYIVTDSRPVSHYEVLLWLAQQLQVDVSQVTVPPAGGAKRLSNARMLSSGFVLRYPDYVAGYSSLLASGRLAS